MGITGELVRNVFSRNRSVGTHESYNNVRSNHVGGDKRRWSAVRSYLCGDEFNSVLAEKDSASVKSSEATVTQPALEGSTSTENFITEEDVLILKEKHNSTYKLFQQEDAAITIQSAFRNFLARRRHGEFEWKDESQELVMEIGSPRGSVGTSVEVQTGNSVEVLSVQQESDEIKLKDDEQKLVMGMESPSRDSVGTSMEVQTGNSVEALSVKQENIAVHHRMPKKARTQIFKIKEDWDDSTVSSNISKMRIQNRLEATNRRQRALAYAFAQQLRICSKRKQTRSDVTEPNIGWSWLERWMATRLPECSVESRTSKQCEPISNSHRALAAKKRFFDVAEEKESCGSNEVSVHFDSISVSTTNDSELKTTRNRAKSTRTISRRKTVPSYHCAKEHSKAIKKE